MLVYSRCPCVWLPETSEPVERSQDFFRVHLQRRVALSSATHWQLAAHCGLEGILEELHIPNWVITYTSERLDFGTQWPN